MAVKLNQKALTHARKLIKSGKVERDIRDDWSEHAPSTDKENAFIDKHGFATDAHTPVTNDLLCFIPPAWSVSRRSADHELPRSRRTGDNPDIANGADPGLVELAVPRVSTNRPGGAGPGQSPVDGRRITDHIAAVDVHRGEPAVIDHRNVPPPRGPELMSPVRRRAVQVVWIDAPLQFTAAADGERRGRFVNVTDRAAGRLG